MQTKVLLPTDDNIELAARLLNNGEVIGMPTETVYGLAACAFDESAIEKIFIAKGRPQDNPLIVHIASIDMLGCVAGEIPPIALKLAEKFWPGPLTMIMPKNDNIPLCVTAGLDTVGVRFPSNKIARRLIEVADMPLAAPSANISGTTSSTTAEHVYSDLNGKIAAIIDGGKCSIGLESTVILLVDNNTVRLLRPGLITAQDLQAIGIDVIIDPNILNKIDDNTPVLSPGMKYKHYSPNADVCIVDSDFFKFKAFIDSKVDENLGVLVFEGEQDAFNIPCISYGDINDSEAQASLLYNALRELDTFSVDIIYARIPSNRGVGLAVYNRILRAAGFEVITL